MNKNLTPPQSAANPRSKVRSKSQVHNPHLRKRMKKTFPYGVRPTKYQEERRSLAAPPAPCGGRANSLHRNRPRPAASFPPNRHRPTIHRTQSVSRLQHFGAGQRQQESIGALRRQASDQRKRYMLVSDSRNGKIYAYDLETDHTVASATVTATSNDSIAAVDIFSGGRGTTRRNASRGPQISFKEGYNIIAIDVTSESRTAQSTYLIRVTKAEAPPTSGGPLPVFQAASSGDNPSESSAFASGIGEGKSQLILAEPLPDGGVRFVFAVPAAEEFGIEGTPALLGETWNPLPEDAVKILRESNGAGSDRLTIILPKAAGKQRFLRLRPLTTRRP